MRERRKRVHGPCRKGRKWRVVGVDEAGVRTVVPYDTEEAALAAIEDARNEFENETRTLSWAVNQYIAEQSKRIAEREISKAGVDRYEFHLKKMLDLKTNGHLDLRRLTPSFAAELYEKRSGAVDTHRNGLIVTKAFGRWCVQRGWLRVSPFEKVKGRGRRKTGKPQLLFDEARLFYEKCLELAPTDQGAVLSLAYLVLGTRASELVNRNVRDVDNAGRRLRIVDTKTEAGERDLEIPEVLVPHFQRLRQKRSPFAPLFAGCEHRKRRTDWAREQVWRICKIIGLPRARWVSPHGLRGTQASLAREAGATSVLVAATLGHASSAITERAYIDKGRAEASDRRTALRVLTGGLR